MVTAERSGCRLFCWAATCSRTWSANGGRGSCVVYSTILLIPHNASLGPQELQVSDRLRQGESHVIAGTQALAEKQSGDFGGIPPTG